MKIILFDFNNILSDLAEELKNRGHEVKVMIREGLEGWQKYDVIVIWNETQISGWRDFVKRVQKAGKKVILVQHGRRGTSRIFPPFNEKLVSDIVCVWGKNDKKRLIGCGVPGEKIRITGTTVIRHLKPRKKHKGINVVFSLEHWDKDVSENQIVAGVLRKIPGVKIITKALKGEHYEGIYDNPVYSDRIKKDHLEICADVLSEADLVVGISESTFELMAEILDIPVVIADIWMPKPCNGDDRYMEYKHEYSDACLIEKNIFNLPKTIKWYLKHQDYLKEQRKQIAINDGGMDIKNPLDEIIKIIENEAHK